MPAFLTEFYHPLNFCMRQRPRRNRKLASIRNLVAETCLRPANFIYPLFLLPEADGKIAIDSMPGMYRLGIDHALKEIAECLSLGLTQFILFPVVPESLKDKIASYSYSADNFYLLAIQQIKETFPEACVITDVAMDPYSSDGHDGLVENGQILNDETLPILARMAVAQAEAGADIIGPSDMMDGRIGALRDALDKAGHTSVSLMAYTAKYASAFYGPFRDALDSAPKFGDKRSYQMDPANSREALIESRLDQEEGADFLMVKPAMAYLDVIHKLATHHELPIVAYQVSGEYAMLHAAAASGWLDLKSVRDESLLSIGRAGASGIISYFAREWARDFQAGSSF